MAQQYIGTGRLGTAQTVAFTGTAGNSAAVGDGINKVRVTVTAAAYIVIGKDATATGSTNTYMPADSPEYLTIMPGERVSAIQVSSGGNLHVTEIN